MTASFQLTFFGVGHGRLQPLQSGSGLYMGFAKSTVLLIAPMLSMRNDAF
jgi:hypothetical protein